jgi:hypothetical protein
MSFPRVVGALLCLAAGAAWADAQQVQPQSEKQSQPDPAAKDKAAEKRETRVKQLGGDNYIRYEVMPGDDEQPPGELIVMHMESPPQTPTQEAQAAPEPKAAPEDPVEARARAAVRAIQKRRAACEDLRMQLAARLLELRGVQVDPEVALWVTRNLYFTGDGVPALQVFADPLFFSAMQSDSTARGLAVDLAHCEQAANAQRW